MNFGTYLRAQRDLARENESLHRHMRASQEREIRKDALIASLRDQLSRLRADADLVALCVPKDRRPIATSFLRDSHRVESSIPEDWT